MALRPDGSWYDALWSRYTAVEKALLADRALLRRIARGHRGR